MGETEVTQGQWRPVMGKNPSNFSSCGDNCPVEKVSWLEAVELPVSTLSPAVGAERPVFPDLVLAASVCLVVSWSDLRPSFLPPVALPLTTVFPLASDAASTVTSLAWRVPVETSRARVALVSSSIHPSPMATPTPVSAP